MGVNALKATAVIDKHRYTRIKDVVAQPFSWYGRVLFPLCHTSQRARMNKGCSEEDQREHWRKLRQIFERL